MLLVVSLCFLLCAIRNQAAPLDNEQCVGLDCKQIMSIPLLDDMKATLKADLDVTEMNKILQRHIHEEIQSTVASVLNSSVHDLVTAEVEKIKDLLISNIKESFTGPAFDTSLKKTPYKLRYKNEAVKFDNVRVNSGGGYDPLTGRFTAPRKGLYYFTCEIRSNLGTAVTYALSKNNVTYTPNYTPKYANGVYTSTSVNAIVEMVKGDYVAVTHRVDNDIDEYVNGNHHSTFSGFFVRELE